MTIFLTSLQQTGAFVPCLLSGRSTCGTAQHSTAQHSAQHSAAQHNTTQRNTTQHNASQHMRTTQHNTTLESLGIWTCMLHDICNISTMILRPVPRHHWQFVPMCVELCLGIYWVQRVRIQRYVALAHVMSWQTQKTAFDCALFLFAESLIDPSKSEIIKGIFSPLPFFSYFNWVFL